MATAVSPRAASGKSGALTPSGGAGAPSSSAPAADGSKTETLTSEEAVCVICRVRPFNAREIELHNKSLEGKPPWDQWPIRSVVEFTGQICSFRDPDHDWAEKEKFTFDACLWSIPDEIQTSDNGFASQLTLFELYGTRIVEQTWKGYNTCFLAYGQTGSGKTYSMMGSQGPDGRVEDPGLIPRVCQALFDRVEKMTAMALEHKNEFTRTFKVSVQYMEIYNEMVKDLLWQLSDLPAEIKAKVQPENMKIRNNPVTGIFVEHLTSVETKTWDDIENLLTLGNASRHTAATKMNERSSRSHAVFKVHLMQTTTMAPKKQFERPVEHVRESFINLVDLAGSERNKKSQATGDRLKEAANINKSLSCLKSVIDALVENSTTKGPKKRIPYRDSHLTSILADSLGGNSKTFMLVTVSPHVDNMDETLQTLKYGAKARQIVHTVHVNENAASRMMMDLEAELNRMKEEIVTKQAEMVEPNEEEVEELRAQIGKTEEDIAAAEIHVKEKEEKLLKLAEEKENESKLRQKAILVNMELLTSAQERRARATEEDEALRAQIAELQQAKTDLEGRKAEDELEVDEIQQRMEEMQEKRKALESDMEQFQKKTTKLESLKWELQRKVEEEGAKLSKLRTGRIAVILKNKLDMARLRIAVRRRIRDRMQEHQEQLEFLRQRLKKQNEDIKYENDVQLHDIEAEREALRSDLENLKSELDRAEAERTRQVETLEARIATLRAENRRRKEAMATRIAAMTASWEKRYNSMVVSMDKQYRELVEECTKKHRIEEEREEKALESIRRKHAAEAKDREKEWRAKIEAAIAKGKKDYSENEAKWERQLRERQHTMEGMRVKLREIDKKERLFGAFQRRVAATLECCPKRNLKSKDAKTLYDLLELFHGLYEENHPSRARMEHLLAHDVNKRRCADPPAIGLNIEEEIEEPKEEAQPQPEEEVLTNEENRIRRITSTLKDAAAARSQGTKSREAVNTSLKSNEKTAEPVVVTRRHLPPAKNALFFSARIRSKSPVKTMAPARPATAPS